MAREGGKDRGLFERPKGSGVWWIRYNDADGKERREKIGSKAAAKMRYQARKAAIFEGRKLPELGRKGLTVGDLIEKYREELLAGRKNEKAAKNYAWELDAWNKVFGNALVEKLQPGDVETWKARRLSDPKKPAKPATINRSLAVLKRLFNLAIRDSVTERNPLGQGRVRMLRENNQRDRFLSLDEERLILPVVPRMVALAMIVALHTGLRQQEQLERNRADVDLKRNILRLPSSKPGKWEYILLNTEASAALREALESHDHEWIFSGPGRWEGEEPHRLTGNSALYHLQAAAEKLGLPEGLTWHALRHTYISRLAMANVPLITVQRLARHKSIQMTLRYAHLAPGHERESLDRLAELYPSATGTETGTDERTQQQNNAEKLIQPAPKPAPVMQDVL